MTLGNWNGRACKSNVASGSAAVAAAATYHRLHLRLHCRFLCCFYKLVLTPAPLSPPLSLDRFQENKQTQW